MSDGKKRLPLYSEPAFNEKEFLKLPSNNGLQMVPNCFVLYAVDEFLKDGMAVQSINKTAVVYYFKGLESLHQGHWLKDGSDKQKNSYLRAFAFFHQALAAKPDYFCARIGVRNIAESLGFEDLADNENYPLERSNNPHPEFPCHLQHVGHFSASDLNELEKTIRKQ